MIPFLTEVSVVVWFTQTSLPRLVAAAAVETFEWTGGSPLTGDTREAERTAAGVGADTSAPVMTRRMTGGLLAPVTSVARLTGADVRPDTGAMVSTGRPALGSLTPGTSPARLRQVRWRVRPDTQTVRIN